MLWCFPQRRPDSPGWFCFHSCCCRAVRITDIPNAYTDCCVSTSGLWPWANEPICLLPHLLSKVGNTVLSFRVMWKLNMYISRAFGMHLASRRRWDAVCCGNFFFAGNLPLILECQFAYRFLWVDSSAFSVSRVSFLDRLWYLMHVSIRTLGGSSSPLISEPLKCRFCWFSLVIMVF